MFQKFYPKEYVKSAYQIDFQKLYHLGYRGLLFDIDNTLVEHGADANESSIELFKKLKALGFRICLLSNNKEERVKRFNEKIQVDYIFHAKKPLKDSYLKALKRMNGTKKTTIFIGDQIFTDIYGANRAGIYSILVKPINKKEEIQIVLKRYLEKIVLYFYKKSIRNSSKQQNKGGI